MNHYKQSHPSVETLAFRPMRGMDSPHVQTVFATLFSRGGKAPPSADYFVSLDDGDTLHSMLSTPPGWVSSSKTIVLIHGLGGSHHSAYVLRMSRKYYQKGYRTLRINLRGIGPEANLVQRPFHGGSSDDLLHVIQTLKREAPDSPIVLLGYSLGGNIALKLMGELGERAQPLIEKTIAVCAPINLAETAHSLTKGMNRFYHRYYLQGLKQIGKRWIGKHTINSMLEFDNVVTAPLWGFKDAIDYYQQSSSCFLIPEIRQNCHLIFAADDPFVNYRAALSHPLLPTTKVWLAKQGGHMGFWGWAGREHGYSWLDRFLLQLA